MPHHPSLHFNLLQILFRMRTNKTNGSLEENISVLLRNHKLVHIGQVLGLEALVKFNLLKSRRH